MEREGGREGEKDGGEGRDGEGKGGEGVQECPNSELASLGDTHIFEVQ